MDLPQDAMVFDLMPISVLRDLYAELEKLDNVPKDVEKVQRFANLSLMMSKKAEAVTIISEFVTRIAIPSIVADSEAYIALDSGSEGVSTQLCSPAAATLALALGRLADQVPNVAEELCSFCSDGLHAVTTVDLGKIVSCAILAASYFQVNRDSTAQRLAPSIAMTILEMAFNAHVVPIHVSLYFRSHLLGLVLETLEDKRPILQAIWARILKAFCMGDDTITDVDDTISQWQSWAAVPGAGPPNSTLEDRAVALDILSRLFHALNTDSIVPGGLASAFPFWVMVQYGLLVSATDEHGRTIKELVLMSRQARALLGHAIESCETSHSAQASNEGDVPGRLWSHVFTWDGRSGHRRVWDIFFMIIAALDETQYHLSLEALPKIYALRGMADQLPSQGQSKQPKRKSRRSRGPKMPHHQKANMNGMDEEDAVVLHPSWIELLLRKGMKHEISTVRLAVLQYALDGAIQPDRAVLDLASHHHFFFDVILKAVGTEVYYVPASLGAEHGKLGDGWRTHWKALWSAPVTDPHGPIVLRPQGSASFGFGHQVYRALLGIISRLATHALRLTFLHRFLDEISAINAIVSDVSLAVFLNFLREAAVLVAQHAKADDPPILTCSCSSRSALASDMSAYWRSLVSDGIPRVGQSHYGRTVLFHMAFDTFLSLASPLWALRGPGDQITAAAADTIPHRSICFSHCWSLLSCFPEDILSLGAMRETVVGEFGLDAGTDPARDARLRLMQFLRLNAQHDVANTAASSATTPNWFVHGLTVGIHGFLHPVGSSSSSASEPAVPMTMASCDDGFEQSKRDAWGLAVAIAHYCNALEEGGKLFTCSCETCSERVPPSASRPIDDLIALAAPLEDVLSGLFSRPYSHPDSIIRALILLNVLATRSTGGLGPFQSQKQSHPSGSGTLLRQWVVHLVAESAGEVTALASACVHGWRYIVGQRETSEQNTFVQSSVFHMLTLHPDVITNIVGLGLHLSLTASHSRESLQSVGTDGWRADFGCVLQSADTRFASFDPATEVGGAAGAAALRVFGDSVRTLVTQCCEIPGDHLDSGRDSDPVVIPTQQKQLDVDAWAPLCRIAAVCVVSRLLSLPVYAKMEWKLKSLDISVSSLFGANVPPIIELFLRTPCPRAERRTTGWANHALRFYAHKWLAIASALRMSMDDSALALAEMPVALLATALEQCGMDAQGATKSSIVPLIDALAMLLPLACADGGQAVSAASVEAINAVWQAVQSLKWGNRRAILRGHLHFFAAVFQPQILTCEGSTDNPLSAALDQLVVRILDGCAGDGTPEGVATCLAAVFVQTWKHCDWPVLHRFIGPLITLCAWPRTLPKPDLQRPQDPTLLFPSPSGPDAEADADMEPLIEQMQSFDANLTQQRMPDSGVGMNGAAPVPIEQLSVHCTDGGALDVLFRHFRLYSGRDYFVRVLCNTYLFQLLSRKPRSKDVLQWTSSVIDGLLQALSKETVPKSGPCNSYRPNGLVFRRRTRLFQSLLIALLGLDQAVPLSEATLDLFWEQFGLLDYNAVRQFADLAAAHLLLLFPSEVARRFAAFLDPGTPGPVARSACLVSTSILPVFGRQLLLRGDASAALMPVFRLLLDRVLPWTVSGFSTVRAAAHYCLTEVCRDNVLADVEQQVSAMEGTPSSSDDGPEEAFGTARRIVRFVRSSQESSQAMEKYAIPEAPSLQTLEAYPMSLLFDIMPRAHVPLAEESIPTLVFSLLGNFNVPARPLDRQHGDQSVSTLSAEAEAAHDTVVEEGPSIEPQPVMFNYQKKIAPWESLLALEQAECKGPGQSDGRSERRAERPRVPLIVVASLIDKVPNLAGLCRTCECFAAQALVVSSKKVIADPRFLKMSVTSEKWQPLLEVPETDLKAYLRACKSRGYTLVGIEQTQNSVEVTTYQFPERTVLVLGKEKEGIPLELIHELDVCLEIPQLGIIRSLNVHVTGGLVIFEYLKQQLRRQR